MLAPQLAQQIAEETTAIVGYNILITGPDGLVIASGDPSRVGTFHEASLDVVRTARSASHTNAQARALEGVRPGVTLPVIINDRVVGTVCITGPPKEVTRFGMIVERITEILLNESLILHSQFNREWATDKLIRDLIFFDSDAADERLLFERALDLGIDLRRPRRIYAVNALVSQVQAPDIEGVLLAGLGLLRDLFAQNQSVAVGLSSGRYIVLADSPGSDDSALKLAQTAVERFKSRYNIDIAVGISAAQCGPPGVRQAYEDAWDAVRLGAPGGGVALSRSIRVAQLMSAAGDQARNRYLDAVVGEARLLREWETLRETLIAWCESGFSIVRTATHLHIHRNTLLYRLDKLASLLGWSGRTGTDVLAVYLAAVWDKSVPAEQHEGVQIGHGSGF